MRRVFALFGLVVITLAGLSVPAQAGGEVTRIVVLSNRADLISGGDALVEVVLAGGTDPAKVRVRLGDRDVTEAFAVRPDGRYVGLVTGMPVGANTVIASGPRVRARITITNHALGGPVFAGPQVQPWICRPEENGLGPARNEQCTAGTRYDFFYQSTDPLKRGFQPYDPDDPPGDVATTTTDEGEVVPFVLRRERGTMDRGIYEVAVLFDPAQPWAPWARQRGWNGKLIWPFGGDCKPWHRQADPIDTRGVFPLDPDTGGVADPGVDESIGAILGNGNAREGLSRGFMVATRASTSSASSAIRSSRPKR